MTLVDEARASRLQDLRMEASDNEWRAGRQWLQPREATGRNHPELPEDWAAKALYFRPTGLIRNGAARAPVPLAVRVDAKPVETQKVKDCAKPLNVSRYSAADDDLRDDLDDLAHLRRDLDDASHLNAEARASALESLNEEILRKLGEIKKVQAARALRYLRGRTGDIIDLVCRQHGVPRTDLLSHRRTKNVVLVRHCAIFLLRALTARSMPEIGKVLGGRDHTTALHGWRRETARRGLDYNKLNACQKAAVELFIEFWTAQNGGAPWPVWFWEVATRAGHPPPVDWAGPDGVATEAANANAPTDAPSEAASQPLASLSEAANAAAFCGEVHDGRG